MGFFDDDGAAPTPVDNSDAFADLLDLYRAWMARKTSDLPRLALRVNTAYQALPEAQRRLFCAFLAEEGLLEPEVAVVVKKFNGSLDKLALWSTL